MNRFPELERAVIARNGRRSGDEIWFRCPFPERHKNGDARPSAKFNPEKGAWYCVVCKEGGAEKELAELLGLSWNSDREIVATYPYTDEDGELLFEVVRLANPKDFRQRRPDGKGGWTWKTKGVRRVLYRLPEILAAVGAGQLIHVVEGEKDADNLAGLEVAATTNSGGAGKWSKALSESLRGARVAIIPDNDQPGRDHAELVASKLSGVAAEVRVVTLPSLPDGGDVSDWIAASAAAGSGGEEIRAELARLVAEAPLWEKSAAEAEGASSPPAVATAKEAIQELWALGSDPDPTAVAAALRRVAAALDGSDPLTIQTARALAMRMLKGKLTHREKLVDAALAGVVAKRRAASPTEAEGPPYRETERGLVLLKSTNAGEVVVPLTNFTARIVTEVARDDGAEVHRGFEIEAHHRGRVHRFEVSASRFPFMAWVTEHLGATAILNAGLSIRDHVRAAIQYLSREVRTRTLYTHLGWRRIGDQWCYLHAGGAIGRVGRVADIETDLPQQLQRYQLPEPADAVELVRSVRASVQVLDVLPDVVTVPVYCGLWRSVLGPCDHSLHLTGRTGEGKTELAALAQQHFGAGLDARNLPGSWSSTGNSLEALAFAAKDGLLVVDDFAPEGGVYDVQRQHREAARLLRAQGNRSGRGRLRPDGELRPTKPPRGLILSTGEDVPGGQSIRARLFSLGVPAGAMDWELLTRCQADAAAGLYAQAMTGFLVWVAGRYDELAELRPRRLRELRDLATASGTLHRRTPGIVADLALGIETFLRFAQDAGALSEAEARAFWERCWTALGEAAAAQAEHVAETEPARRFLELLSAALASGRAHVASDRGSVPEVPAIWGWRHGPLWTVEYSPSGWQPQGDRIGWVRGEDLYLEPGAAFRVAQAMAPTDGLTIKATTLWKRLKEKGLLASTDEARQQNQVRVSLEGARRPVLHLRAETVMPQKPAQPAQPAHEDEPAGVSGRFLGAGLVPGAAEPAQQTRPAEADSVGVSEVAGRVGRVGRVSEGHTPADEKPWGEV